MKISTEQIKELQVHCSGKFRDRAERLEAVSDILGFEINSFTELNSRQAEELLWFFNTGQLPQNETWARFDRNNTQHRTILSRAHTLGWVDEDRSYVDLNRLGGWLKSNRSPVQKPMKEMSRVELSRIIKAMDSMITKKYK